MFCQHLQHTWRTKINKIFYFWGDLTWSSGRENSFQKFRIDWNDEAAIFVYRQLGVMRNAHCVKRPTNKKRVVIGLEIWPIRKRFAFILFIRGKKKIWRPWRTVFPKVQILSLGTVRSTNAAHRPGKNSTERWLCRYINLFICSILY